MDSETFEVCTSASKYSLNFHGFFKRSAEAYKHSLNGKRRNWTGAGARRGGAVVKVLTLHARDPIWVPVLSQQPRFPSSSLPVARESSQDGPKLWDPEPRRRPGRGSWLRIGIALAVALTWGVTHQMKDLPLCLSSLYIHLSNKKIIKINL